MRKWLALAMVLAATPDTREPEPHVVAQLGLTGGARAVLTPEAPFFFGLDGAVGLRWIRRARDDAGRWTEHEVSLDEDRELYRVDVMDGAAVKRRVEVEAPAWRYDAAMQAADWGVAAPSPLRVEIAQISPRFVAPTGPSATTTSP